MYNIPKEKLGKKEQYCSLFSTNAEQKDVTKEISNEYIENVVSKQMRFKSCDKAELNKTNTKVENRYQQDEIFLDPLAVCTARIDEDTNVLHRPYDPGSEASYITQTKKGEKHFLELDESEPRLIDELSQEQCSVQVKGNNIKYVCHICTKTFGSKNLFIKHLSIHTGQKLFTCRFCKKSFSVKDNLEKHMLIKHSDKKPFSCNVCQKVLSRKDILDRHMLIHSGEKAYSCDQCTESFIHKQSLVTHKRIHTGEKPYVCDTCKKAFADRSSYNRHRRTHTGERPYSCKLCDKAFTQTSNLHKHMKIHKK